MPSSASTRSPPRDRPVALYVVLVGEDHPKECTGRRLVRRGLARPARALAESRAPPVVLDPYADRPLSADDRAAAERGGLLAVDCSWNRLAVRGRLPGPIGPNGGRTLRRRLPILVAANPQHYGRLAQLNTVEALAAALRVLGHDAEAGRLLEGFRGGPEFLTINAGRLADYANAPNPAGVRAAEGRWFGGASSA